MPSCGRLLHLIPILLVLGRCALVESVEHKPSSSARDECPLGEHVRPIVYTPGYGTSVLFNYTNDYSISYPTGQDIFSGGWGSDGAKNLELPLQWYSDGSQQASDIGPKPSPEAIFPGTDGISRTFISAVSDPLASLVQYWEDQNPDGPELWYPVSWDWRRDFWEQSEAVYKMALLAKNQTGCNPILVGHSFGGVLTYTAFTRYREKIASHVHAVLYATAPLQPFSGAEQLIAEGLPFDTRIDAHALFSFPSIWALLSPLSASCVNAPNKTGGEPRLCRAGEVDTGVSCEEAACGRPDDWPEDLPYYLPIDLQDPETHYMYMIGRRSFLQSSGKPSVLSQDEKTHIKRVTEAVKKVHSGTIGEHSAAVARLHPPTITLSLSLTTVDVPLDDEDKDFTNVTTLGCVAPDTRIPGDPICNNVTAAMNRLGPYDGLLPSQTTFLLNSKAFGDKLQSLGVGSPHSWPLHSSESAFNDEVECASYSKNVTYKSGDYPSLESMICSLVLRGEEWIPTTATSPRATGSENPTAAMGDGTRTSATSGAARLSVGVAMGVAWVGFQAALLVVCA